MVWAPFIVIRVADHAPLKLLKEPVASSRRRRREGAAAFAEVRFWKIALAYWLTGETGLLTHAVTAELKKERLENAVALIQKSVAAGETAAAALDVRLGSVTFGNRASPGCPVYF